MAKSKEVIWWSLFAQGGAVAALFIPVLIAITGYVIPLSGRAALITFGPTKSIVSTLLGRVFFAVVIALPLFHCAHRIRHTLIDLGVHGARMLVATVCYGAAFVGTAVTVWLLATMN